MFATLNVGDRVRLSGGHERKPKWLAGKDFYAGTVMNFIPVQSRTPAAIVKLDHAITFDQITGYILVLELRYESAKWTEKGTVHVELCDFEPEVTSTKFSKQGKWVESHATYVKS
jgi:hypothetical protein